DARPVHTETLLLQQVADVTDLVAADLLLLAVTKEHPVQPVRDDPGGHGSRRLGPDRVARRRAPGLRAPASDRFLRVPADRPQALLLVSHEDAPERRGVPPAGRPDGGRRPGSPAR